MLAFILLVSGGLSFESCLSDRVADHENSDLQIKIYVGTLEPGGIIIIDKAGKSISEASDKIEFMCIGSYRTSRLSFKAELSEEIPYYEGKIMIFRKVKRCSFR